MRAVQHGDTRHRWATLVSVSYPCNSIQVFCKLSSSYCLLVYFYTLRGKTIIFTSKLHAWRKYGRINSRNLCYNLVPHPLPTPFLSENIKPKIESKFTRSSCCVVVSHVVSCWFSWPIFTKLSTNVASMEAIWTPFKRIRVLA
jgi:hypothetical protein